MTPEEFYRRMMPYALAVSQQTGVDPRIVIAQSAIETGYGRSAPQNNFFGIKGPGGTYTTTEYGPQGKYTTQDSFRGYGSMAESAADYADFINKNPRYKDFRSAQGLDAQLAALQKSGYATDPNYSAKVGGLAKRIVLDPSVQPAQFNAAANPATPGLMSPSQIPQNIMNKMQSGVAAPWTEKLGMAPTTANTMGNIGGLLAAMSGGAQPVAPPAPAYENRPDPRKLEELFGGLLA